MNDCEKFGCHHFVTKCEKCERIASRLTTPDYLPEPQSKLYKELVEYFNATLFFLRHTDDKDTEEIIRISAKIYQKLCGTKD